MKQKTVVGWLVEQITDGTMPAREAIKQALEMESKEKLKNSLFIGKVTEILGFDKTVELLKQCNDEII